MSRLSDVLSFLRKILLVLSATLLTMTCANAGESPESGLLVENGVIFSAQQAMQAAQAAPISGIQGPYWTPTERQIKRLKTSFTSYVRRQKSGPARYVGQHFEDYRFQYVGYSDHGVQLVLINGFCESFWKNDNSWRTDLVVVLDGGACFFQARYRMSDLKLVQFEVNGEA